jgi:O-methyltransferase domain/Dimerisation domain
MNTSIQKAEADEPAFFQDAPQTRMYQMIWGFTASQIVHTAARLRLAEHLAAGAATAEQIAKAESLDFAATFRLLCACTTLGLMTCDAELRFASTPLLRTLHPDATNSLRGAALLLPASSHWLCWARLTEAVRTGEPQAQAALGCTVWEHLAEAPEETAAFAETMKSVSAVFNEDAANAGKTLFARIAVDVGGANGSFVHALMKQNTSLHGIVFDLPHVVPTAMTEAVKLGIQNRFSVIAGDVLTTHLPSADLYLLKLILHDWNDRDALAILRNCRRAINPGGRIIVVEQLLGEIGEPGPAAMMDINMLVMLGGKERTLEQYQSLFTAAGFRFLSVTSTRTPFVLMQATVS